MAGTDTLRDDIARLEAAEATLRKDLARHEGVVATERAAADKKRQDADRTRSDSTRRSSLRSAEGHDQKMVAAQKKVADVKGKLSANSKAQAGKRRSLAAAGRTEQQAEDRTVRRRRDDERAHAREVARLSRPAAQHVEVRYVPVRPPEPEPLRVLYLTANPEATDVTTTTPDGVTTTTHEYLRMDREVRAVQQALRGAKYRDLVDVGLRPAATTDDLIDALNDTRPHLVHFAGHGWAGGVVFDDGDPDEPGADPVGFDLLAEVLAATDVPPQVLVLNACESLAGADLLLPAVPVVIAMAASIDDTAAIVFARRFYAAIASAQPVGRALAQAKAAMRLAAPDAADLPQARVREDVDPDSLVLVRPPHAGAPDDPVADLLRDQGLGPLAVALLRHVGAVEADETFAGVLPLQSCADAVGAPPHAVRVELRRLLDDGYLRAGDVAEDFDGGYDLVAPRLTTLGVAALARSL